MRLNPCRFQSGSTVCEPVIVVRRQGMGGCHLWTLEQLENKLVDMRELFSERGLADAAERTSCSSSSGVTSGGEAEEDECGTSGPTVALEGADALFESQERHSLVGVANVFLGVLFHNLKLDYPVTIISQQGEACGKLLVEVYRVPDEPNEQDEPDALLRRAAGPDAFLGRTIKCRVGGWARRRSCTIILVSSVLQMCWAPSVQYCPCLRRWCLVYLIWAFSLH